jgi:hypothetical protein
MSTRAIAILYGATMGLAGFLLFQVQPVMAKYILPWFGGSAATWIVCMLFFQLALLAGYAYAYLVTRPLSLGWQVVLQILLLAAGLLLLPITPSDSWKPSASGDPTWRIIVLLTASVGAPYALLATTSPLLQRWLAQLPNDIEISRLFAISNFGSFLGLLSYPFIVERVWSSQEQTSLWSVMFSVYAALFGLCAWVAWRAAPAAIAAEIKDLPESVRRGGPAWLWIAYSALGSVLLLATTNQITQWSAVIPFLWIAPLSLYLLTFVVAFGSQKHYRRPAYAIAFLLLAGLSFILPTPDTASRLIVSVIVQCLTMFAGCMICHAEMVKLQPEPTRLPSFYLATAIGGAIGGLLVALAAPLLLADYWEQAIVASLIAAFALRLEFDARKDWRRGWGPGLAVAGLLFAAALSTQLVSEISLSREMVARVRNFYGVVKVLRDEGEAPEDASLVMQQAGVDQGSQFLAKERRNEPACAFTRDSAVGQAIFHNAIRRAEPQAPIRVGIVGLGAGMLAALGQKGDVIRYYELNPAVKDLVDRHFGFVRDSAATIEIALGDGRLLLEREAEGGRSQQFDVVVMNAFRGASPPMHLMTKEAFDIYLGHLKPDGVLAINFELDTLEVAPLHRGLAAATGLDVNWVETASEDGCEDPISWALYTRDKGFWEVPSVKSSISRWRDGSQSQLLWTDRNSNLMSIVPW